MRCLVCDHDDKWVNVDEYRTVPKGMSICSHCGFVSYPSLWKSEEEIKQYYRKDYRKPPTIANYWTGHRKLHFHNAFLKDVLKKWRDEKAEPVVGEVGAAYGLFLNFVKEVVPGAKVSGTELTTSYRRNAFHEFGIELSEDFDFSKKYDLIASYKVAEHMCDVDRHIRACIEALKPGGLLYISVPTWFGRLTNFGMGGFDLEYYYSTNHINVWTRKLFEYVLKKAGAKVIKFDDQLYDESYLCVRDDSLMQDLEPDFESYADIRQRMAKIKKVAELYAETKFDECVELWPDFPEAWVGKYEKSRQKLHQIGFDRVKSEFIAEAFKACPRSVEIMIMAGDLSMRYERYNEAIEHFENALQARPGLSPALKGLAHSLRHLSRLAMLEGKASEGWQLLEKARNVMRYLRQVSPQDEQEALNWIYDDNARLPMPSEIKRK
jgi:SAM-dependent methyltransferase